MIACLLSAACEVEWLRSQRGFHDVRTVVDWNLGPRDCSSSVSMVASMSSCFQVVVRGGGSVCRALHRLGHVGKRRKVPSSLSCAWRAARASLHVGQDLQVRGWSHVGSPHTDQRDLSMVASLLAPAGAE
jgi:hypothetical protein